MKQEKINALYVWGKVVFGLFVYAFFVYFVMVCTDAKITETRTWVGAGVCWIFTHIIYRFILRNVPIAHNRKTLAG